MDNLNPFSGNPLTDHPTVPRPLVWFVWSLKAALGITFYALCSYLIWCVLTNFLSG